MNHNTATQRRYTNQAIPSFHYRLTDYRERPVSITFLVIIVRTLPPPDWHPLLFAAGDFALPLHREFIMDREDRNPYLYHGGIFAVEHPVIAERPDGQAKSGHMVMSGAHVIICHLPRPIGVAFWQILEAGELQLEYIIGDPRWQRQGVRSQALRALLPWVQSQHPQLIIVTFGQTDDPAQAFYARNGFVAMKTRLVAPYDADLNRRYEQLHAHQVLA